jgi:hypothetical protein
MPAAAQVRAETVTDPRTLKHCPKLWNFIKVIYNL